MKARRQAAMPWVMITLALAVIPQAASMPAQMIPLIILPIAWRWAAEYRGWGPVPLPLRIAVTGAAVLVLVVTYGSLFGRRAAVSLLTLMLALKLLETFRVRDARIVASLSLFLCGTQFLFSQGMTMLLYAAAVMVSALVALIYLQRQEAFVGVPRTSKTRHSLFSELGYSARLLLMAAPAALLLFLLFPRWSSPLWGVPETALDAKTGLSDSMSPGSIQELFMDDSPAFRADFANRIPEQTQMYWRGPVFWAFDGREWRSTFYSRNVPAEEKPPITPRSIRYTVQMEPTEQRWLFALDYPAILPRGTGLTMDYQLMSRRSVTRLKSYEMVSNPQFIDSPRLKTTHRAAALSLPDDFNPQTRELVNQWRMETPDDTEFISRVLAWFNQEEFSYTLNPPPLSRHTVDDFLFETRSGFCEHYASAFTVMMRMAGIPARVVTGYQGGWYNDFGNYVLVRQSDAHAWTEAWLPGAGWTRVDPTAAVAPSRVERGALDALSGRRHFLDYPWLRDFRNGFDLLQRRWNDWVIAFGLDQQSRLFRPFGMDRLTPSQLVGILTLGIAVLAAFMMPLILRMKVRTRSDPALRQWQRFRHKLERAGVGTEASMTPDEVLRRADARLGAQSEHARRITRLYLEARYGAGDPRLPALENAVRGFRPARQAR
ncbi:MAG: DUF3488 domain-containing transglutaminase family protein [Xanthomonadales bacterium]|nr:DUF3488 domain-containing transglutaminase family protein [Xanthomonadales bacterium]